MTIQAQASLLPYNTFGLDARAEALVLIQSVEQLQDCLSNPTLPIVVLGGGSNILLTKDIAALVLKNEIKGKKVIREYPHCVHLAVGGGENWHELVLWTLAQGWSGLENLSLIPGTVGAAPIQNIGAYGVELQNSFVRLEAIEIATGQRKTFSKTDCRFGYRDSIFKREAKGKYIITEVVLRLAKRPKLNLSYGAILTVLKERGITNPTPQDVSQAVIQIRSSKLPDPAQLGNSGSFFKNPEISTKQFATLQKVYPKVPHYPLPDGKVKVPAGWLIEQCGWKGKRVGNTGAHAQQALVLVNYGDATGQEVFALAQEIIRSVQERFAIALSPEVNVW